MLVFVHSLPSPIPLLPYAVALDDGIGADKTLFSSIIFALCNCYVLSIYVWGAYGPVCVCVGWLETVCESYLCWYWTNSHWLDSVYYYLCCCCDIIYRVLRFTHARQIFHGCNIEKVIRIVLLHVHTEIDSQQQQKKKNIQSLNNVMVWYTIHSGKI